MERVEGSHRTKSYFRFDVGVLDHIVVYYMTQTVTAVKEFHRINSS
jgi:hypothetical protein